jgi:hypothetical protein
MQNKRKRKIKPPFKSKIIKIKVILLIKNYKHNKIMRMVLGKNNAKFVDKVVK